jgi:dihydroorotate dehydrogenase electron transfer subunit
MSSGLPLMARVVEVVVENPRIHTLVLDRHLDAEPGQFVMAWLPGVDERPISLARARPVTLTVANVGPFSAAVQGLAAGDGLWIRGPLGRPFALPAPATPGARLLLVAGGYGVAPMHFLGERALEQGWQVEVVIGARTAEEVIYQERFAALGVEVRVTTDDGSLGRAGLATEAVQDLLDRGEYRALYACGPEAMLEALDRLSTTCKLPAQVSYEGVMRCGFGVCGTCARGGWLVCRDGPVREVGWT